MRNLIYPAKGNLKFSWKKTLWMYIIILPIFFIDINEITFKEVFVSSIITFLTVCLGHSVGLHRGVIHKTYKTSRFFKNILVYLFVLTGLGSPLSWLRLHYYRDYWQNKKNCPKYFDYEHSLFRDYWWNLHLSFSTNDNDYYAIPKKDLTDKWLIWLDKTWLLHNLFLALVVYLILDINAVLIIMNTRITITILAHWYIGYASHKYGYVHFKIVNAKISGFNDFILGLISFAEGFHNNHHAFPSSAKFSVKKYEIDIGWYSILLLKRLGLISVIKTYNTPNIEKKDVIKLKKQ